MNAKAMKLLCPRCSYRIPTSVSSETQRLSCPNCGLVFDLRFEDQSPLIRVVSLDQAQAEPTDQNPSHAAGSEGAPSADQYEGVRNWQEHRGDVLGPVEEKLHVLGLFLAVIGLGCAVLAWFAAPLGMTSTVLLSIALGGAVATVIAACLLLYTMRRQQTRALVSVVSLLVVGGGLNAWIVAVHYDEVVSRREQLANEENPRSRGLESNITRERRFDSDPLDNPAAKYVPPPRRRDDDATAANAPSRFRDVDNPSQVSEPTDGQAEIGNDKPAKPTEGFRPDLARDKIDVDELEHRTRANPFGQATDSPFSDRPTVPSGKYSPHEKRQRIADRITDLLQTRVSRGRASDRNFHSRFAVTREIGSATVLGRAYYKEVAARGLDAINSVRAPSVITRIIPFYDQAEFPDSLYRSGNYYLAGINAHFQDDTLVGIQAVLAPVKGDHLDLDRAENSVWFGKPGRGSRVQTLLSPGGSPVYGIVVYEEKLKISGLALIVAPDALDN